MARVLAVVLMAFAFGQTGALSPAADMEADFEVDRPGHHAKGSRSNSFWRALAEQQAQQVASTGCVNLGGDNWYADAHGELFHVVQDRCWITFSLRGRAGEMYEKVSLQFNRARQAKHHVRCRCAGRRTSRRQRISPGC